MHTNPVENERMVLSFIKDGVDSDGWEHSETAENMYSNYREI
jgi:hypothetical protein